VDSRLETGCLARGSFHEQSTERAWLPTLCLPVLSTVTDFERRGVGRRPADDERPPAVWAVTIRRRS